MLKKNLIIIVSIVVVIAVALIAIHFMDTADDDSEPPEPVERIFVLGGESDSLVDVLTIEVQSELGMYTIVNTNPHEMVLHQFALVGFEDFNLQRSNIMRVVNAARSLQASDVLFEEDANLYAFGLESPAATVTVSYPDGSYAVLFIGDVAPGGNSVYAMREGDFTIYLISSAIADIFLWRDLDFVDLAITETIVEMPNITRAVLGGSVRPEPILIEMVPEQEGLNQFALFTYKILTPVQRRLHMYFGFEPLVSSYGLRADSIVARFESSEELLAWGLYEPYSTLEIESATNENFKLEVSAPDEDGYVYLVREGLPFVFNVSSDFLPWLRLTYFDMMDRLVVLPHIDSVSVLEIHMPDRTVNITLEGEGEDIGVFVDGVLYEAVDGVDSVRNFRLLYQDLIATSIDSIPDDPMSPDLPVILRLVYNYRDGSPSDSVTFFEGAARRVFVQLNDETPMLALSRFVDHLFRSIDSFLAGEMVILFR